MYSLHQKFQPPKKTDTKKWSVVRFLVEHGFTYIPLFEKTGQGGYLCAGKYPETMKDAIEFVKQFNKDGIKK